MGSGPVNVLGVLPIPLITSPQSSGSRRNRKRGAGFPCGGEAILHILTKDGQATRRALESAGFKISTEQPVVVIDVEDKPGASASLYRRIADANVNVNLTYVATNNRLVVGADNIQKVKEALTKEAAPAAARR